jgi:hypothetical protein
MMSTPRWYSPLHQHMMTSSKPQRAKFHVMLYEIQNDEAGPDDYHFHCSDALFDIDCPNSSIQAYATNFRPNSGSKSTSNKVCMPSN